MAWRAGLETLWSMVRLAASTPSRGGRLSSSVRTAGNVSEMHMLPDITFSLFAAVTLLFWALFFLVVLPRINDRGLAVKASSRFGFLLINWPFEELELYEASLQPEEQLRWFNLYLRRAGWMVFLSFAAHGLALLWAVLP